MTSLSSFLLVSAGHYLWRASHMFKEGLTPKEFELIEKKRKELQETQMLLSKIAFRLRQTGRCT